MNKYDVEIARGYRSAEIAAENEAEARRLFVALMRDNLSVEHCEAWPVEED